MGKLSINFRNVQKILVPTDGSDYSIRAAEYAIGVAKMVSAQILVVYVIDEVVLDLISKAPERDAVEQALKEDGHRYVNYVVGLAEREGVKSSSILTKGRPYEQIVHLVKESNIDLIVMGTYGLRGAERILIGSVAERVIEYAPCPVLVIK
jgi:nucleotide-binding universal stress UspA family protein